MPSPVEEDDDDFALPEEELPVPELLWTESPDSGLGLLRSSEPLPRPRIVPGRPRPDELDELLAGSLKPELNE